MMKINHQLDTEFFDEIKKLTKTKRSVRSHSNISRALTFYCVYKKYTTLLNTTLLRVVDH